LALSGCKQDCERERPACCEATHHATRIHANVFWWPALPRRHFSSGDEGPILASSGGDTARACPQRDLSLNAVCTSLGPAQSSAITVHHTRRRHHGASCRGRAFFLRFCA